MINLIRKILRELISTRWNIGFVVYNPRESIIKQGIKNIHWLNHDFKNRWFADPFILRSDNEKIEVLVEEWIDEKRRGRISKLTINRKDFSLKKISTLLELDTHLSFPFIERKDEKLFVIPENCATGKLRRYLYNEKKESLELDETWAGVNAPLTDAISIPGELSSERDLIFSTEFKKYGGASGNRLGVYENNKSCTYYKRIDEIHFEDNTARSAGAIFQDNGKWIRPAQDCNKRYGHKVVFQEIKKEKTSFKLNEILRVAPSSRKWNLGIHTFNLSPDKTLGVVDGYCYRTPFLGPILSFFRFGKFLARIQPLVVRKPR